MRFYFGTKLQLEEFVGYTLGEDAILFLRRELTKEDLKRLFKLVADKAYEAGRFA